MDFPQALFRSSLYTYLYNSDSSNANEYLYIYIYIYKLIIKISFPVVNAHATALAHSSHSFRKTLECFVSF